MTIIQVLLIGLLFETVRASRPLAPVLAHDSLQATKLRRCPPIAFVQKTHTLTDRFINSAKLAKEQIERCGGYHRVMFYAGDQRANPQPDNGTLRELYNTLGKHAVIVFGPADVSVAFGIEWDSLQELANGENFMWHRGDAYEITWFELFSDDLPPYIKHIWFAEYDVGWTGHLPTLLTTHFPASADFICSTDRKPDGVTIGPDWCHFAKRNWLLDADVRMCLVMLVRYSRRMLAAIRAETKMRHFQYSEMTGATICTRHGRWCSLGTFGASHAAVGRDAASGATLFAWDSIVSQEVWANITAAAAAGPGHRGALYHSLKW